MRSAFIFSAIAFIVPTLGAPTVVPITKRAGPVQADSFIIKFKDGVPKESILQSLLNGFQSGSAVTYSYGPVFNGIAAKLVGADLTFVQRAANVESIEQDSILSISYEQGIDGLSSVGERSEDSSHKLLSRRQGEYKPDGSGVTVYGIDTGVYIEHNCFEGRAKWGKTFGNYSDHDGNGHGTHTAGTVAGKDFGVAQKANIVAVKVLSDEGSGALSHVLAGVNYAFEQFVASGKKPSIATMSLGGPGPSKSALATGIQNAIAGGLHFTIAAGNDNLPADGTSPANTQEANTIGAVDANSNNQKASFSNYGGLIDVWAPGVNIKSAWIGRPDKTNTISGTSMATPYVAGVLAVALSQPEYATKTPAELSQELKDHATNDVTFAAADAVAQTTSTHKLARVW